MGNYEIDARFALTAAHDCGSSEWARMVLKRYLVTRSETNADVERALSEYRAMCLHQATRARLMSLGMFDDDVQRWYWLEGGHNRVAWQQDCKVHSGRVVEVGDGVARVRFVLFPVPVIFNAELIKPEVGDNVAVHKKQIAMKF
jgi:hypothetical protein